ncbi:MAG: hypothetical protein EHM43_03315 [Ignavibacteriae bacterium]|nr:MAG: hypothetical protein EHM43_03315 [Ignavibacteriota bacterium]
MKIIVTNLAVLSALFAVIGSVQTYAQFDTEPTMSTEVIDCIDSVSLRDVLVSPPVPISRSIPSFQVGLNWYGMDGFSQHFGVGLIDNHMNLDTT